MPKNETQSNSQDYLDDLGSLALGSRLKRLSERLVHDGAQVYKANDLKFEPRWFPVFSFLVDHGPTSVTDLAIATGVTHPAINQIAAELSDQDLIRSQADPEDARRRLLVLTDKALEMQTKLQSVWQLLHAALSDINEEVQVDLVNTVFRFEQAIAKENLVQRVQRLERTIEENAPRVVSYDTSLAQDFARLNRAWIEKHFRLEAEDLRILYNPERLIQEGGEIFFVLIGEKAVGTVALMKSNEDEFEVAKMAVDEAYRGKGIGKLLLVACIEHARATGARSLVLETNTKLAPAIHLYRSLGFVDCPPLHDSKYTRADLTMRLPLKS